MSHNPGVPAAVPQGPKPVEADPADPHEVGAAVRIGVGVLVRRLRAMKAEEGEITLPESAALTRLDRGGPATAAALARAEQISPQAMGVTLAALEARGLITRQPDPGDGRRVVLSVSSEGLEVLRHRRSRRTQELADALAEGFSADELATLLAAAPLLERLAERL
jgi:DNA-binding MarR family transcriptional regulator